MSLLNQADMEKANRAVGLLRNRRSEVLHRALYSPAQTDTNTPVGYKRLTTPQDRDLWQQHLSRQALAESEGRSMGQNAQQALPEVAAAQVPPDVPPQVMPQ